MSEEIYSAAKAVFSKDGKTRKEVWEDLTTMFNPEGRPYTNYIDHRCPGLEPVIRQENNTISGYDVFKYTTGKHGVARYVHIIGVSLYKSFSFDQKSSPDVTDHGHNSLSRTEFFLLEEESNIWVEMRLRFKGVRQPFSLWKRYLVTDYQIRQMPQ